MKRPNIAYSMMSFYTASKNDTDVVHYNFEADQPILVIFDRNVPKKVRYQKMICYPTSPN